MNAGILGGLSSITNGTEALQNAKFSEENGKFQELLNSFPKSEKNSTISSSEINRSGGLNGDYTSGFNGVFSGKACKEALPKGAAANQANNNVKTKKIDKSSKLYEKSMELESYFVKQMLSAMRKTVSKSGLASSDFAGQMYEDMLYDEYAESMTKSAGFGLADQIYLSLI